jgi:predicted nuclease of predicted toxin-antitoxin system
VRFLFDENLSRRLVDLGATHWPDSTHVEIITNRGATDAVIWALAQEHGLMIVSKDDDFRNLALVHGPPPKVVWIQAGNASTARIAEILLKSLVELEAFADNPVEALLVLRDVGE